MYTGLAADSRPRSLAHQMLPAPACSLINAARCVLDATNKTTFASLVEKQPLLSIRHHPREPLAQIRSSHGAAPLNVPLMRPNYPQLQRLWAMFRQPRLGSAGRRNSPCISPARPCSLGRRSCWPGPGGSPRPDAALKTVSSVPSGRPQRRHTSSCSKSCSSSLQSRIRSRSVASTTQISASVFSK